MKFTTKCIRHYPPHLRHVATLPWEIKNSHFLQLFSRCARKCKQIAYLSPLTFYSSTNFDIFGVSNSELFSILVANKIFHVTVFYLFTFAIILWHRKFVTANVTMMMMMKLPILLQCLSTVKMIFSDMDKILIKHINMLSIHS